MAGFERPTLPRGGTPSELLTGETRDQEDIDPKSLFPDIVGTSDILQDALMLVAKVAPSNCCVLILGESGTGKELIASAIHRLSLRSHRNFVAINCSAIPEELLEAELFGHEKGAFTGADRKRIGHFGAAHQGTLFLDEIGDMPARLQAKLLRVLQEKKYSPLGSTEFKDTDIRILAATNQNLEEAVKAQTFRLDLYYRINVMPILLPPLSERTGDIPLLVDFFLEKLNRMNPHNPRCWFERSTIEVMNKYPWPGNIRQLQNLIERLFIVKGGGKIAPADLPQDLLTTMTAEQPLAMSSLHPHSLSHVPCEATSDFKLPSVGVNLPEFVEHMENSFILQALERTGYNKNQAAKLLGLNRTTLVERLKKRNLNTPP